MAAAEERACRYTAGRGESRREGRAAEALDERRLDVRNGRATPPSSQTIADGTITSPVTSSGSSPPAKPSDPTSVDTRRQTPSPRAPAATGPTPPSMTTISCSPAPPRSSSGGADGRMRRVCVRRAEHGASLDAQRRDDADRAHRRDMPVTALIAAGSGRPSVAAGDLDGGHAG